MDNLQYTGVVNFEVVVVNWSFKPYYKWITFNTVYNLRDQLHLDSLGFKPYYKWITFNTKKFNMLGTTS